MPASTLPASTVSAATSTGASARASAARPGPAFPQPLGEVLECLPRLCLLLAGQVHAATRSRKDRTSAAARNDSAGAHFVDSSRIRELSGYSHISATSRRFSSCGLNFSLRTKIGPKNREVVQSDPLRCVLSQRTRAAPSRTACAASPHRSPCRGRRPGRPTSWTPSRQTRRASHPPPRRSRRAFAASSAAAPVRPGRSFTTESSPLPCTRRARVTTPALYRLRSGVSKK